MLENQVQLIFKRIQTTMKEYSKDNVSDKHKKYCTGCTVWVTPHDVGAGYSLHITNDGKEGVATFTLYSETLTDGDNYHTFLQFDTFDGDGLPLMSLNIEPESISTISYNYEWEDIKKEVNSFD